MLREYESQCPCYGEKRVGNRDEHEKPWDYECNFCKGCRGFFSNGVDCGYSKTPIGKPKFHVGQTVFRNGFHFGGHPMVIRAVEWDGRFEWRYVAKRERTWYGERELYKKEEDAERSWIIDKAKVLFSDVERFEKRFGKPIGNVELKLLK